MIQRCFIYFSWKVSCHFGSRKELLSWPTGAVSELASLMETCGSSSYHETANFSKSKQISILSTTYLGVQFVCLYLVPLFDFISAMKLRYANNNEIPARSICHVSRERDVLGLIALRKHDTQQLFLICVKKKSICNLHVIDMPWNEQTISVSLFFLTIQFTDRRACV